MSADFTPTMHGYTGQGAFKFWCQKVLPLVYDDSLSYYELLCKVVNYLNNVISDVSATESNVQSLYDSFVALQNYVNEYFDNLDVSKAVHDNVSSVFNEYSETDEFKTLVDGYVNDYLNEYAEQLVDESVELKIDDSVAGQIDDVVAEQLPNNVPSAVTDWLNENVDPVGSAVVVDSSLSISGAAADAKATGNAVNAVAKHIKGDDININEANNLVNYDYNIDANFIPENVSTATGIGINRQTNFIILNTVRTNNGARIKLNGEVIRTEYSGTESSAIVDSWTGITLNKYHKYRIKLKYISGTPSDSIGAAVSIYEQGTHSTIGKATVDGNDYEREFVYMDTPVNIVLLALQNSSYSNYCCSITLEDVTDSFFNSSKNITDTYNSKQNSVNYGYLEKYGNLEVDGSTIASCIGIEQSGILVRLNGRNTADNYVKIKLTLPVRTTQNTMVDEWTGIDLQLGHRYKIVSTLISGSVSWASLSEGSGVRVAIYRNGTHTNFGNAIFNEKKQWINTFTAVDENFTPAIIIEQNDSFTDAVFCIEMYDVTNDYTDYDFLTKTQTVRLFNTENGVGAIGQSMAFVDGTIYAYSYSPEKIWKIDLINRTLETYDMNLGHGNGMAYYNGFLYVCGMGNDGVIYKVDVSNMTIAEQIVYTGNGSSPVINSGIAYNYDTDKFVLKVAGGFHIVSTSFVYESAITRKYISGATGQGISCDKDYIYVIEYNPNDIHIYDYNGNYYGKVVIDIPDEPENIYNDGNGGWYMISNVGEYSTTDGFYIDCVRFKKDISLANACAIAKLFGKISY